MFYCNVFHKRLLKSTTCIKEIIASQNNGGPQLANDPNANRPQQLKKYVWENLPDFSTLADFQRHFAHRDALWCAGSETFIVSSVHNIVNIHAFRHCFVYWVTICYK